MAYASKYYDPQKAHAYYMENRVLKGYENRYGGSRGSYNTPHDSGYQSQGKSNSQSDSYSIESESYNQQLEQQQEESSSNHAKSLKSLQDDLAKFKQDEDDYIKSTQKDIENLRNEIKNMSKEDRRFNSEEYRDQIFELQQFIREARASKSERMKDFTDRIKDAKQAQADEQQRLRQQTKGGSTSGFNQKGKEAAAYIKKQMEAERDSVIKKANDETDNKMLNQVKQLKNHIDKVRSSGQTYSSKQFLAKINSMLGSVKKTKTDTAKKHTEAYKTKYKQEIDNLRSDDSMFTYWDKRAEKVAKRASNDANWRKKEDEKGQKYNERERKYMANHAKQKAKRKESLEKYIERQKKKAEREAAREAKRAAKARR